jgi:GT2 family glycosyltransferase
MVSWEFCVTFSELQRPPGTLVKFEPRVYQIDVARNNQVDAFLRETEFTHHLWLDDDIVLIHPDSILQLLSRKLPIVSGVYSRSEWPYYPIFLRENKAAKDYELMYTNSSYPKNRLVKVDAVGAGLLLVRRDVYEKLTPPYFVWQAKHGEDVYFCKKVRDAGFQIYVDTNVEALHMVRVPVGPDHLRWEWYARRYPPGSHRLSLIRQALSANKLTMNQF